MKLRIVTINDVYVLDNFPRLRSLVRHHAETDPADAFLVTLAGDFLSPSILSSLDSGRGMVDALNALGVTHVTFGNHEDDLAREELVHRISELHATWLATNVREVVPTLPTSDVLEIGGVRVGLLGVVMNDASVYRRVPFGDDPLPNANEAALAEIARLEGERRCDFVVPLTHQFVEDDRVLARRVDPRRVPVILGGHDHSSILENVAGVWIVKAKADAFDAGIVDVTFDPASGEPPRAEVRLESVASYPEDAEMRALVDRHMSLVAQLDDVPLLTLGPDETLSSVGTRSRQTSMGTLVASSLRDVLGAEGAIFNGGGIRGARVYEGRFTYGALKTEVPFDNEIVVAVLPGRVLAEAIAFSRAKAPIENAAFLQVDDRMLVDESSHAPTAVGGEPFDPDRDYRIALVRNFFEGLDDIVPLVRYAKEHPERIPRAASGRDVRVVLASAFSVKLWKTLGGFDAVDSDADGRVTHEELEAAIARDPAQKHPKIAANLIVNALDTNADLVISREEAAAVE